MWRELLYREFFAPSSAAAAGSVEKLLAYFEEAGWIERQQNGAAITPDGEGILVCLDLQTRGVVECYEAVCLVVVDAAGDLNHDAILERGLAVLTNAHRLGHSGHPEAANQATFGNAVDLLLARRILERTGTADSASATLYAPGEEWASLGELHELLARPAAPR